MHLVFVILNSFLYSIRLLHRNHKPHDWKCQSIHYTYTPNHAPIENAIHAPALSASYHAPNENAIHAPAPSASYHAPNENAIHAPAPSASNRAPNENAIHAPAPSASYRAPNENAIHAPAPHALPLTHRTKLRTKKTGRQPAHADCPS